MSDSASKIRASDTTQVVLLGTGTPNADPERSGPSVAIVVNDTPYLVDAGPGVIRQAAAAHQAGIAGLAVERLNRAFLTHLHSDHTVGYADLLLTPWVLERTEPLNVYGPTGLKHMTEHVLVAYQEDIRERLEGLEPANTTGCRAIAHEIVSGLTYQDKNVRVEAFPVRHGSWTAFGFKFHTPDRTIIVSGDTAPTQMIVEQSRGCDVLIHEVYSAVAFQTIPPDWQRYHAQVHTSSHELAEIAGQARPGLLVLYHQLFWGASEQELLDEIQERYDEPVVSGRDLDVL
jgi:ribonuclease BN (tRNA processing enzyme)